MKTRRRGEETAVCAWDRLGVQEERGTPAASRRALLRSAAASAIAALAGPTAARAEGGLTFGLTPVCLSSDLDLLDRLRSYLVQATGGPVDIATRRTYQEITAMLISGELDAAWICGFPFVAHRALLDLVAVPVWRGRPLYQSYLIVGAGRRGCAGISELRGDIHAFSDPDSNSGYLATAALLARTRERPETFFGRTFFTYAHRNVVRAVAAGLADSGSVDGYVWEVMTLTEPGLAAATRIVRRSDWLGFPPIATSRMRSGGRSVAALRVALIGMAGDDAGRSVLRTLQLDGFAEQDASLFDGIAAEAAVVQSVERAG